MMEEYLLGFDVRQLPQPPRGLWEPERRGLFLLGVDAAQPRSVDTLVWPSVFDTGQGTGLPPSERRRLGLAGIPARSYTGPNAGLWEDLPAMVRYWYERQPASVPAALIAISWLAVAPLAAAGPYGPYPSGSLPIAPDPAWQRLGYDVADGSRLSGLSNCGYSADEARALRPRWAPRLNEHHLFDDPAEANGFRALTDMRVPEHAPFFIYGLYQIEEIGG